MGTKQKISANGTYVFDPEEIEQLDELSMTSVLSAVVDQDTKEHRQTESTDGVSPARLGDTTINELLSGQIEPDDAADLNLGFPAGPEPPETADDLIDPDLIFPELTPSNGRKGG
jgi:hypothetical protein